MKRFIFLMLVIFAIGCLIWKVAHANEEKLVPYRFETHDKTVQDFRDRIMGTPRAKTNDENCLVVNGERHCYKVEV